MTAPRPPARPALLEIAHLSVRFGTTEVVQDLSLSLQAGQTLALVGESGSGKSVTAQSVLRLLDDAQTTGSIRFDGQELTTLAEPALRAIRGARIGMIFQEPMTALNPVQRIGTQIAEVLVLHRGLGTAAARERAIALLARTGIAEPERRIDAYPHQLSGGQRQRAMIAMALACAPQLLICDEPTTALDVTVQAQILELLAGLQAEFGMAILFITHDLNLVRRFCGQVGVMARGRLVEQGPTEAVFAQPQHPDTRRLLATRPQRQVAPAPADAPLALRAEDLRVGFDAGGPFWRRRRFAALDGVSLQLRRGHTLGIVGESGSGKTTLGLALLALQGLDGGAVWLGDGPAALRLDRAEPRALRAARARLQVVLQDPFGSLSPRRTIGQTLDEGLALHQPQLDAAQRLARVQAVLDEVGLSADRGVHDVLGRYPHEFSGGQRQRIAIARALVLEPEVLILDEPTSALDASVQQQVLGLLAELQRRRGLAYVFISHDLAVIRAMAHEVIVLQAGRVVEQQAVEALFAAPRSDCTRALLAALGEPVAG
ncbi:MAG: hypothetical protein RLY78_3717 [Pseudomonadota bacterium]